MSYGPQSVLHDRMSSKERLHAWLITIGCIAVVAITVVYLLFQARDEKALYEGYEVAVAPMTGQIEHSFDPLDTPVDIDAKPKMVVWPKKSWKRISLEDGRGSSITVMGQATIQGRIYGVDLYHGPATRYISPVDISMGWQRAATDASFASNSVHHGNRAAWSRTQKGWPHHQFSNSHLIPASWEIYQVLKDAKPDDRIAITGWPVTVRTLGIRPWISDLNIGDRNCEIMLITAVRIERADGSLRGQAAL